MSGAESDLLNLFESGFPGVSPKETFAYTHVPHREGYSVGGQVFFV